MLKSFHTAGKMEAGCDEAGRGCLAGPVFAAAVVLPADWEHALVRDSKTLSQAQRTTASALIRAHAISWAIARVDSEEIDQINILKASFLAMNRAVAALSLSPDLLLIDGNRFIPAHPIPFHCIIKGDGKFMSIAAASILAKTARDEYMEEMANTYPGYGWAQNKGYPTAAHRAAIRTLGPTPLHRKTFRLLPSDNQLPLL